MMKTFSILMITLALACSAVAGTGNFTKNPVISQPEAPCFGPGFGVGFFGGGFLPRHKTGGYDDALGGGVLAEYFFCEYFGVQFSYGAFATSGTQHVINGDLVFRAPIQSACVAPYLLIGGGFHVDGETLGVYHAGAGVEIKFKGNPKMGVFADGTYNWHNSDNRDRDYTLVRVGMKFQL